MGLLDYFRSQKKSSAESARERLTIIIQQQRTSASTTDYLPMLKRELLEVIRKYVKIEPEAVQIKVHQEDDNEMLELSVTLPPQSAKADS
jgi:cell division topological specificity factor